VSAWPGSIEVRYLRGYRPQFTSTRFAIEAEGARISGDCGSSVLLRPWKGRKHETKQEKSPTPRLRAERGVCTTSSTPTPAKDEGEGGGA
jgi:hypothetical protein